MNYAPAPDYASIAEDKANFDDIYVQPDPRAYYRVLHGLDYVILDLAKGVFIELIAALEARKGRPLKILDLGCSYGNNAALIKYPLDIDRLAKRYRSFDAAGLSTRELIRLDRNYFAAWPKRNLRIVGLDASAPAVNYAWETGIIDDGLAIDLEGGPITPECRALLAGTDLIISTGSIGYVTARSFGQALSAIGDPPPWVASFVFRLVPFAPIGDCLAAFGLETEKLEGVTFIQRRFHSQEEYVGVLEKLERQGIDPTGKEERGFLHAEFHLSRPPEHIEETPLASLVSVTSGANRQFGRRYWRGRDEEIRFGK